MLDKFAPGRPADGPRGRHAGAWRRMLGVGRCAPALAQGYPVPPASIPQAPNQPAYPQPAYQQAPYQPPGGQPSPNQTPLNPATSNPVCVRLEGQLAAFDRGTADPGPRRPDPAVAEDAIAKKQADIDRATAQAHKAGCAGSGFFALFSALSPQCGPITSQIQQMRGDLDRMMSDLRAVAERHLRSGRPAPRADRAIGAKQLRRAIHRRGQCHKAARKAFSTRCSAAAPSSTRTATARRTGPITPSACVAATAIISRSPIRRCRRTLPKTS